MRYMKLLNTAYQRSVHRSETLEAPNSFLILVIYHQQGIFTELETGQVALVKTLKPSRVRALLWTRGIWSTDDF